MKIVLICILFTLCMLPMGAFATSPAVETVVDSLPLSDLQKTLHALPGGQAIHLPSLLESALKGEIIPPGQVLLDALVDQLGRSLMNQRGLFVRLLVPALLCALLSRLREALGNTSVAEVGFWACYLWVAAVVVEITVREVQVSGRAVDSMATGMEALFPILLTLLSAIGGTNSAAFLQPAIVAASGMMTILCRTVAYALALAYTVLVVLDNLWDHLSLSRLTGLVKTFCNWSLGLSFTVFLGVMTVQGFGAAAMDGVTIRTAKYAVDSFVPVVGGMLADTVDALVSGSLLVSNALGITGLVLLCAYMVTPLLSVLSTVIALRVAAAVLEPLSDRRIVRCMGDTSNALVMLATTQACIAAMFFLLVAQLLVMGNITVMMR